MSSPRPRALSHPSGSLTRTCPASGKGPEGIDLNLFVAGCVLAGGVYCYNMGQVMDELAKIEAGA